MTSKILFVDDEENILNSIKRNFRKIFQVHTAVGPLAGLKAVREDGPFAAVVSDLKMPDMDGITFLAEVQKLSPATVRIMLTGHADLDAAISAVNKGHIFRFLTKPCPAEEMLLTLREAVRLYSLEMAEKELLRGTLRGSIRVLTDILSLVNPESFGRGERVRRLALYIARQLQLKQALILDLAAMLSQLGCVTLPDDIMKKLDFGLELTPEERQIFEIHPSITARMLEQIPRMDKITEIILQQNDRFDEHPTQSIEARILKACIDFDHLVQGGKPRLEVIEILRSREGWYDTEVIDILERGTAAEDGYLRREVHIDDLAPGMILVDSLWSLDEVHIMAKGTELTPMGLARLENFKRSQNLPDVIRVLVPVKQ